MREMENGISNQALDSTQKDPEHGKGESQTRIAVLEDRIETLEKALQALLKEKEEVAEKEKEKAKTEEEAKKPTTPELSEEEKLDKKNWTRRFQWRRPNPSREGEEYIVIESPDQENESRESKQASLVHDEDMKGAPERILIRNPKIQSKLRDLPGLETFEEVRFNLNSIEINTPFSPLFHYIETVMDQVNADESSSALDKADMYALSKFCKEGPVGSMFEDIRKLMSQGLISAEQQWALFRPGIQVVTRTIGEMEVLVVKSIRVEDRRSYSFFADDKPGDRYLVCNQIAWNGKAFGQREREIRLQKYPGSRKLVELDVCPLDRFPVKRMIEIMEGCVARGKTWKELCEAKRAVPKDCDTRCLPLVSEERGYWDPFAGEERRSEPSETRIAGRVIVDPEASAKASKIGTMTETFTLNTSEIEPFKPESYEIEDEESQYLRCSALIEVFSLVDHVWYRVPVLNLNDPEWMQDPWDQLELSAQRKTLLRTLVNTHTNQNKRSGDLIKKKGKGLVFLFHGQPGLGKTLTAEALSESIKRPLYRVNIGLLAGHQDWEPDLEKIFRDAHSWQAVLLLDEAEVIMEARTKDRMQQNSWCSVFLRKLEYYEGILILTTNMIHSIDKAFRSRINIAIHYDDLSLDQKTSLWKLFIGNLHAERAKTNELLREVDRWAKLNLNGRQIRNVVLTAEALALGESDYLRMEPSHVDTIIKDTMEFNQAIDNEKKRRAIKVGSVPGNWL